MRKAILACMLLTVALVVFGQHGKSQIGGKATHKSKPKAKPKPTPNFEGVDKYLKPIPPDELLFTGAEQNEILGHGGWRLASTGAREANGQRVRVLYDRKRIEHPSRTVIRTWLRREVVRDSLQQSYSMDLSEYDCAANRHRLLLFTNYDESGHKTTSGASEWVYVIPESVGERVFAILCRDRADEEQINMELAMGWFGDGRRAEKKRDMQSAVRYYKLALEFAPNNPKLTEALARVQ